MILPIRFPDEGDVIAEEAARFRALSPQAQVRALGECYRLYHFLRTTSGREAQMDRLAEEEEQLGRDAIREFCQRYG